MRIEMVLFYDFEMTGLHKNTTPISLGIVSEDGKKFYAEFIDFDRNQVNEWIQKNVLDNFILDKAQSPTAVKRFIENGYEVQNLPVVGYTIGLFYQSRRIKDGFTEATGTKDWISKTLNKWLSQFDSIQFVSDVCHYDFVLLIDLLTNGGTALDLSNNISAVCHDLNQDIARHFGITDAEAFDMSREQIMNDLCGPEDVATGDKHNSLYDAEVIRAIYEEIGYDI